VIPVDRRRFPRPTFGCGRFIYFPSFFRKTSWEHVFKPSSFFPGELSPELVIDDICWDVSPFRRLCFSVSVNTCHTGLFDPVSSGRPFWGVVLFFRAPFSRLPPDSFCQRHKPRTGSPVLLRTPHSGEGLIGPLRFIPLDSLVTSSALFGFPAESFSPFFSFLSFPFSRAKDNRTSLEGSVSGLPG